MSFAWFFVGAVLATWWSRAHHRRGWRSICGRHNDDHHGPTEEQLRKKQKKSQIKEAAMDATLEALQTFRIKLAAIRLANPEAQASINAGRPTPTPVVLTPQTGSSGSTEKVGYDTVYV
jgi:hypothetical protein